MSDSNSLIPISDEQAKAIQEFLKTLQGMGSFLKETRVRFPEIWSAILEGDAATSWLSPFGREFLRAVSD
jgi:hypothetical protein